MISSQIEKIIARREFPDTSLTPCLQETHTSWVILTDHYAFKIRKPVSFSFLDFSTIEDRSFYSQKELTLNNRLSENVYLRKIPVWQNGEMISLREIGGKVIDWAVVMRRMKADQQMDIMLANGEVTSDQIRSLAEKIAGFHRNAEIIYRPVSMYQKKIFFNDLNSVKLQALAVDDHVHRVIDRAIGFSNRFLLENQRAFRARAEKRMVRDGHGDLHSGNIFLENPPVIFDCLEFNDDLRQIDVLEDIAFLCMDLEVRGREDLSRTFLKHYLHLFPVIQNPGDESAFRWYKLYRANVRLKIALLKVDDESLSVQERKILKGQIFDYADIMDQYLDKLSGWKKLRSASQV